MFTANENIQNEFEIRLIEIFRDRQFIRSIEMKFRLLFYNDAQKKDVDISLPHFILSLLHNFRLIYYNCTERENGFYPRS